MVVHPEREGYSYLYGEILSTIIIFRSILLFDLLKLKHLPVELCLYLQRYN